ncbi:MAG: hypothetical protein GY778_20760 [bacterium]|nr:hypothetical protein [bacterium]
MNRGGRLWLPLAGTTLAVAAAGGLGYYPTVQRAGEEAWVALVAGCVAGLLASWLGIAALVATGFHDPARRINAILTAMATRFVAVLGLGLAAALTGWFALAPLLIWIVISHLVALFVETLWLVNASRSTGMGNDSETDR